MFPRTTTMRAMTISSFGRNATFALTMAVALGSCSKDDTTKNDVLAEVDDLPITAATFEHWWKKNPPQSDSAESREALLEKLIDREALVQRARRAGLDQDPEVIEGIESLLIARLKELELQPEIAAAEVSEADVRAVYEADESEPFTLPARTHVAALWFDTRGQAPLAARYQPRLAQVRDGLLADPDAVPPSAGFGPHSVRNSEHRASRYKGGDLGWIQTGSTNLDPFRKAVSEITASLTEPGEVSAVTVRPEGVFLVRLVERQGERVQAFAEVRESIEGRVLAARRTEVQQQFYQETREGVSVKRFDDHLHALSNLPTSAITNSGPSNTTANLPFQP